MQLINYGLILITNSVFIPTITRLLRFTDLIKINFSSILSQVNFVISANHIINSTQNVNQSVLPHYKPILLDTNTLNYKSLTKCSDRKLILKNKTHATTSKRRLQRYQQGPNTPELIYVPHIFRWLKTKFLLRYLRKRWDPEFSEGAFIYGTIHALCKITDIIHRDKPNELEGLLTEFGEIKLRNEMSGRFTDKQKEIIKIQPNDVKILVPITVTLKANNTMKECSVSLRSLALKWFRDRYGLKLVLVAIQSEFIRDYSKGADSEWIINTFDVLECTMLSNHQSHLKK